MDEVSVEDISSSILKRARKIRLRMMVEKISGVPAGNKQVFLSHCLRYEKMLMNEYVAEKGGIFLELNDVHDGWSNRSEEQEWKGRKGSLDDWPDWDDWHKLNSVPGIAVQVH